MYVANTFFLPARSAILPDLLEGESLVKANSLATLAGVAATLIGSLAGGFLVQRVGWRWGFAADAATYVASVVFLAQTRPRSRPPRPRDTRWEDRYRTIARDAVEGAKIAAGRPAVVGALAALALLWVGGGALHVAGTVLIERRTAGFISGMGGILSALGAGMVVGTLALAGRGARWPSGTLIAAALSGIGLSLLLFAFLQSYAALLGVAVLAGVSVALLLVTTESLLQREIAAEVRGRVFALRDFVTRIAVLVFAGATGVVVGRHWLSPEMAVAFVGAGILLGGLAAGLALRARIGEDPGATR
jgi:predicted MFS family arabinose efflux permease